MARLCLAWRKRRLWTVGRSSLCLKLQSDLLPLVVKIQVGKAAHMFPFNCTIENVKECILDAEQNLRDLLSTLMKEKHGPDWQSSSTGWPERERLALEKRRADEQRKLPHQQLSTRLLDYSSLLDLKALLERHWDIFGSVFISKDQTLVMLDKLNTLRNLELHARPGLEIHQRHLILGICGELLLAVHAWRGGYKHRIKTYGCSLRFSVYEEDTHGEDPQVLSRQVALKWLNGLQHGVDGVTVSKESEAADAESYLLRLPAGHVRAELSSKYRGSDGRCFRSADVTLASSNLDALKSVIEGGDQPYWIFSWTLADDLSVEVVASLAKVRSGKSPSSSSAIQVGSGPVILTNADFLLARSEALEVRVSFGRAASNGPAIVTLIADGGVNGGFRYAHRTFALDTILKIIYGELTPNQTWSLIQEAMG